MASRSRLLYFPSLVPLALALVPHSYWSGRLFTLNRRSLATLRQSRRSTTRAQWSMYFDDCERNRLSGEWEAWLPETGRIPWMLSRTEEKKWAIEKLLGYTPKSASALSAEQIEDETLRWALDCNVIWAEDYDDGDDDNENSGLDKSEDAKKLPSKTTITSRYSAISDLLVASDCHSIVDSLAFLWNLIAKLLDHQEQNSVYMLVFPNVTALWDYDAMVTVLQALTISMPLLPAHMQHVQLDLFHPDYKHSPRMWSPEMHSPFPTLGMSIQSNPKSVEACSNMVASEDSADNQRMGLDKELESTRMRLEALFDRIDADDRVDARPQDQISDVETVLVKCKAWAAKSETLRTNENLEWVIDSHTEPYQLYNRLWSTVSDLQKKSSKDGKISTMLVAPNLDAHTTMRLAITVNAALQRLGSPIRVVNVFHPNSSESNSRQAPHATIQLM